MYPMNLRLEGRKCLVIGGGKVALRKVQGVLQAGGSVTIVAPELVPELQTLVKQQAVCWDQAVYGPGDEKGFFLVFCAADDRKVNRQAALAARAAGSLVNAASEPELCDFMVPARVERGKLLLTVSTGGGSPAFSRLLRRELEQHFGETYGLWLEHLEKLRRELRARGGSSQQRQEFWRMAMEDRILDLVKDGQIDQAEAEVRHAIDGFRAES